MPEGFVMIEDFVPGDFKQLPIDLIQTAESEFSARNLGESAASLRASGKVFRLQAKQASSAESRDQIYTFDPPNIQ